MPVSNPRFAITHALSPASETSDVEPGDFPETEDFAPAGGLEVGDRVLGDVEVMIA